MLGRVLERISNFSHREPKLSFDEECSKLLDKGTQTELRLLQNPSQMTGDKLTSLRREANRNFRNKERGHLKDQINEVQENTKNESTTDVLPECSSFVLTVRELRSSGWYAG
jgi:hypothetical protein